LLFLPPPLPPSLRPPVAAKRGPSGGVNPNRDVSDSLLPPPPLPPLGASDKDVLSPNPLTPPPAGAARRLIPS